MKHFLLEFKNGQQICVLVVGVFCDHIALGVNSSVMIGCVTGFMSLNGSLVLLAVSMKVPTVNLDGNLSVWNLHVIPNHARVPQALPH